MPATCLEGSRNQAWHRTGLSSSYCIVPVKPQVRKEALLDVPHNYLGITVFRLVADAPSIAKFIHLEPLINSQGLKVKPLDRSNLRFPVQLMPFRLKSYTSKIVDMPSYEDPSHPLERDVFELARAARWIPPDGPLGAVPRFFSSRAKMPVTRVPRKPPIIWKVMKKLCSLLYSGILPNIFALQKKGDK